MFDVTFKFKTLNSDALLLYTSDDSQSNTFVVFVRQGHIVVNEVLGDRSSELKSHINTYNDGNWHYVSIMKMGQSLTMSIDDYEMVEASGVKGDLLTTTPLYFGGVPYMYQIESKVFTYSGGIKGCIGDITVNKKFKNLAHVQREGISFAECSLEKEVKPVMNPNLKPDQCALPQVSSEVDTSEAKIEGVRFGADKYSRQEFKKLPVRIRIKPVIISITFKTTKRNGVLFYTSDRSHIDFLGIYLLNGQVHYGFDCGSGAASVVSQESYNDGEWHTVKVSRRNQMGTMEVDGIRVGTGRSRGKTRSLNTKPPYYLGGISEEAWKKAMANLMDVNAGFSGCIKDVKMNMLPMMPPSEEISIQPCADNVESGAFLGKSGGNIKLYHTFKVGQKLEIDMDIKPRSMEGILLAVHKNQKAGDFILLQMSAGQVIFSTDNGRGVISSIYKPATENSLCDGQWHNIKAIKDKSVLRLSVDGFDTEAVEGKVGSSSADTKDPLYIGGVEDLSAREIVANGTYVGCIRNVYLNGKLEYLATGAPSGDVKLDSCPLA